MSKVSTHTELTRVDPRALLLQAYRGRNYSKQIGKLYPAIFLSRFTGGAYRNDFWNTIQTCYPWDLNVIGAGTMAQQTSVANHPGITRFSQNGANTGARIWMSYASPILISGLERTELIFQLQTTSALVLRFGFGDNFNNAAAPTDGIWIDIAGATLSGKTRNNGVESTTGTTYASATATWYRAYIVVNADASRVDFYLYNSTTGLQLWTDNLTTNIPKVAGRELSHGMQAYKTSAGVVALVDVDFMNLVLPQGLDR